MCGIAGFWDQRAVLGNDARAAQLRRMTDALRHRGPDDQGAWIDPQAGVALGQRRLSIIDLSPAGHQPMPSADRRLWIVFNGEIYNYQELRKLLESDGIGNWRGHSDTEVLLAAIGRWGLHGALERVVGMFAFALWDAQQRTLSLVRDRLGEKPLYYGWCRGALLFGSELKALRCFDGFDARLDAAAIADYLRHACIAAPRSIYASVLKLPPAHVVEIRDDGRVDGPSPYWSWQQVTARPRSDSALPGVPRAQLADTLDALLRRAVAGQMIADVPLGAFLSGGVDSSTIVALMQAQSTLPIRTFAIGFEEKQFDEAGYARAVARHLGTDHTELYVTARDALDVIPKLPEIYDEPFGDSSQIPTFLVAQLARTRVTVALSGDGGDELFGGYSRYGQVLRGWQQIARWPAPLRRALAAAIAAPGPIALRHALHALQPVLPRSLRGAQGVERLYKLADLLRLDGLADYYARIAAMWPRPEWIMSNGFDAAPGTLTPGPSPASGRGAIGAAEIAATCARFESGAEALMALDLVTYLPDDILVKVDRAAMASSLETRVPLLDHRVVEFAWQLPLEARVSGNLTKRVLRDVLYRYVPPALIERPKQGFGLPIGAMLRGPLRAWAEDLLAPQRLRRDGILQVEPVRRAWDAHLSGRRNLQYPLWTALMLQAWLDAQRNWSTG